MFALKIRKPAVAGSFYPANINTLKSSIEEYINRAEDKTSGDKIVRGLVSPHAGYVYSGPVAGWSFKQVLGKSYETVIIISPSHMEAFRGCSIYDGDAYRTPLGEIEVNKELSQKIVENSEMVKVSEAGHKLSGWGQGEHALEVQLPFLQVALKDKFDIVPIIMGHQMPGEIEDLSAALADSLKNKNFLIVASSDLSHFHPYEEAKAMDKNIVDLFNEGNDEEIMDGIVTNGIEACGGGPVVSMMKALKQMGNAEAQTLYYATSGDVPIGEKDQVVGYMSGMILLPG